MKLKRFLLLILLSITVVQVFAYVPQYRFLQALPGICPVPYNCTKGANFITIKAADHCGCCKCHGGVIGCNGGANGIVMCLDGTRSPYCNCQYTMRKE